MLNQLSFPSLYFLPTLERPSDRIIQLGAGIVKKSGPEIRRAELARPYANAQILRARRSNLSPVIPEKLTIAPHLNIERAQWVK